MRKTMFFAVLFAFVAASLGMLHAQKVAGPNRPAGVPDGYVITPFGYFHPSCVRHIAAGSTVLADGRVQHADGAIDEIAPVCNYPRYSPSGKLVTAGTAKGESPSISQSWIEDGSTTTNTAYGEISATWTVPPSPTADDGQTIYFFPGFDNYSSDISILQPVLGWNSNYTNAWGIASWNCCPSGTADYSSAVRASPGDTILGTVTSTCGAGTQSCSTWKVTTDDQSSSLSTTLNNTPSEGQTLNWAFAGALEVYNVAQCSDYPPNGPIIFNASLYDDNFNLISSPGWSITNYSSGLAPQCNYGGQVSGTQVTLEYSAGSCTTVPSAPTGLAASSTTSSGTSLSWTADTAPANCSITSYTVLENGNPIGTATSTSYTVSSLSPSTTYSFTVDAKDTEGTSAGSSAVSVTTLAPSCTTVPSAPTGLAASSTTSSGTSLSWTADTAPASCPISSYTVLQNGGTLGTTSGTSYTVSGLSASTTYSFTVEATNADGTSAASSALSVTTTPPPSYSLSASPTHGTVSPGGSSTATVTVSSANGYTGSVTLLCTISPVVTGATAPTCGFASTSPVKVTSSGGTATMTFTTVVSSAATLRSSNVFYARLLPISGVALIGFGLGLRGPRRNKLRGLLFLGMLAGLLILPACGGGGGTPAGTPGVTYTITITGTDASHATQSGAAATVTVTVT